MKKLLLLGTCVVCLNAAAQIPPQPADSLHPVLTDSLDFKDKAAPEMRDSSSRPVFREDMRRRDSLPMDDRKPKNPPKKES